MSSAISEFKLLVSKVTKRLKERLVDGLVSGAGEMLLWMKRLILHLCSFKHEKLPTRATAKFFLFYYRTARMCIVTDFPKTISMRQLNVAIMTSSDSC
jgi:hypothetical protein